MAQQAGVVLHKVETEKYTNVFFVWNNNTRNDYSTFLGHIDKETGFFYKGLRYNERKKVEE